MTTTVLNTKTLKRFGKKIPDLSSLVERTDYNAEISDIEKKHLSNY